MHIGFGNWVWVQSGKEPGSWRAPAGLSGAIDLRPLSEQGAPGMAHGDVGGVCLVASENRLGSEFVTIAEIDSGDSKMNGMALSAFESGSGFRAKGDTAGHLIYDLLTRGSHPDGELGVRPLMPDFSRRMDIHLPGLGKMFSKHFSFGDPETSKIVDVERLTYAATLASDAPGITNRKLLGMLSEKYGVARPQDHFIRSGLEKVAPLRPETTFSDDFNRADTTFGNLGANWTLLEAAANSPKISSNQVITWGGSGAALFYSSFYYNSDLSGTDHTAQISINTNTNDDGSGGGVLFRKAANSTLTFYSSVFSGYGDPPGYLSTLYVYKLVSGTQTAIGSLGSQTLSLPVTVGGSANGSTIKHILNAVDKVTVTDTAITTGLRSGLRLYHFGGQMINRGDNWTTSDLMAAGPAYSSSPVFI